MQEQQKDIYNDNVNQQQIQKQSKIDQNIGIEIKRNRRCSRNDKTPRKYSCGCGRGYYSYPALYTHLKIKHSGLLPEGTQIPNDKHYGSRGRPKEKKEDIIQDKQEIQIVQQKINFNDKQIYNDCDDDELLPFHSDDRDENLT